MNASRWDMLAELLEQALALPPDERAAFLDALEADDPHLRVELASLLAAYDDAPGFFEQLGEDLPAFDPPAEPASNALPHNGRIGPYRLVEEIGRGGMGRVFLAERADIDKRVALKLVRGGLAAPETIERFLFERRVLARLEHPHIARLLDAGMTDDETPFFAMEYVEGETITAYCDRRRLSVDDRLRLFEQVGEAVQYAHRNLVVHRDLKPSNILVAGNPGSGPGQAQVKLLDFGIAKLLEDGDEAEMLTRTGLRVMTPEYAAPEQVTGDPVTTATDVYALGIVLYELLTGQRPYDVRDVPPSEVARRILHTEPEKPSTAVSRTTGETTASIAAVRATTDERLRRRLAGDLDTIVLKALRKEPDRRYQSADQFLDDIKRHLAGLPVSARPDTSGYRLRKFVQRNRLAVGAVATVVLALTVGLGAALWQGRVAAAERDRAERALAQSEEVSNFLLNVFGSPDPYATTAPGSDTLSARTLLLQGAARAELDLKDQPELQATMLDKIGVVCKNLGLYSEADTLLSKALAYRRTVLSPTHLDVATSLNHLGDLYVARGAYTTAEARIREALALREQQLGPSHLDVSTSLTSLGEALWGQGRYDEAVDAYRRALAIRRNLLGENHPDVAFSMGDLALAVKYQGHFDDAEDLYRQAIGILQKQLGLNHPRVLIYLNNIAELYRAQGRYEEAAQAHLQLLQKRRAVFGNQHPDVANTLDNLGGTFRSLGQHDEAIKYLQEGLTLRRTLLDEQHPDITFSLKNLAATYAAQGHYHTAVQHYREVLKRHQMQRGPEHPDVAEAFHDLGRALVGLGAYDEAEAALRKALALDVQLFGRTHRYVAIDQNSLGACLAAQDRYDEAEALLLESHQVLAKSYAPSHQYVIVSTDRIVELYKAWGKPDSVAAWQARASDDV